MRLRGRHAVGPPPCRAVSSSGVVCGGPATRIGTYGPAQVPLCRRDGRRFRKAGWQVSKASPVELAVADRQHTRGDPPTGR